MYAWKKWLFLLSTSLFMCAAHGKEMSLPAPLEPWRGWVLDQYRELTCPPHYASLGERYCRWPGK